MKGLFLGTAEAAANLEQLKKRGITHILSVIEGEPAFPVGVTLLLDKFFKDFKYLILECFDSGEYDMVN